MSKFKIFKNLKNYEITCKIRGHHEPENNDVSDFILNMKFPKETYCQDCGFSLELEIDDDNPKYYWVNET